MAEKGRGAGLRGPENGGSRAPDENFFLVVTRCFTAVWSGGAKLCAKIILREWKMVVSLQPLSTKKRGVEKEPRERRRRERFETDGKRDSVCRTRTGCASRHENESKEKKSIQEILTMKSLILAQDER